MREVNGRHILLAIPLQILLPQESLRDLCFRFIGILAQGFRQQRSTRCTKIGQTQHFLPRLAMRTERHLPHRDRLVGQYRGQERDDGVQ